VKTFIRKLSVLMVLFSGAFLLLGEVVAPVFCIQTGSLAYCVLQFIGFSVLILLLGIKKLHVF